MMYTKKLKSAKNFWLLASALLFLVSFCNSVKDSHSPQVTPEIVSIDSSSVSIKWNNVGSQYYYSVFIEFDSMHGNDFSNIGTVIDSTTDTFFVINGLQPKTWYKVTVGTHGGNLSPNESWPPLRFETE